MSNALKNLNTQKYAELNSKQTLAERSQYIRTKKNSKITEMCNLL